MREFDGARRGAASARASRCWCSTTAPDPAKPDAIFPNNWVSFHADGTMVLYPMATAARRLERNPDGCSDPARVERVRRRGGWSTSASTSSNGHFLEGTGSLVLDRPRRRALRQPRARAPTRVVIADFDDRLDYSTLLFDAHDRSGRPIYHTNVLLSLGTRFAILCTDAVAPEYRELLIGEIEASGRTLIAVDYDQMRQLRLQRRSSSRAASGPVIALSSAARRSFRPDQLRLLESFGELVEADIPTIEAVGGGSVRCMIADVHLPRSSPAP